LKKLFNEKLYSLDAYTPGNQPKGKVIKLNTNENPFPPSPRVQNFLAKFSSLDSMRKYPSPTSIDLRKQIAKLHKLHPDQVLVTNGSDEALAILFRACLNSNSIFLMPDPTYSLYTVLANLQMNGVILKKIPVLENFHLDFQTLKNSSASLLAFANPNAPTGILESKKDLGDLIKTFGSAVLCDEAYIDFAKKGSSMISEISEHSNLFVSRTFSKSYSLAGLRVGYIMSSKENIFELNKIRDSYNLGYLEQKLALESLKDQKYLLSNVQKILIERNFMNLELQKMNFKVLESSTNFLFAKPSEVNAKDLFLYLEKKKIHIRYFESQRISEFIRITISNRNENSILLNAIKQFIKK
jgi:histidinol-phosphate aminotransferase